MKRGEKFVRWSEFLLRLGVEPDGTDPESLAAWGSSPPFEDVLKIAIALPVPADLLEALRSIPDLHPIGRHSNERSLAALALAAVVVIAVAAGIISQSNTRRQSVEDYLVSHYSIDGEHLEALGMGRRANDVEAILAGVGYSALPVLQDIVGYIKYCPTPDGRGVHMVLHTAKEPVTVILMPSTPTAARSVQLQNGMQAVMFPLSRGSVAIMGRDTDVVSQLGPIVQASMVRG